jgi:hypothetical protein
MAHDPLAQPCQPLKVRVAGLLVCPLALGIQASLHAAPPRPLLQTVKLDLMPNFETGQGRERDLQLRQEGVWVGGDRARVDERCRGLRSGAPKVEGICASRIMCGGQKGLLRLRQYRGDNPRASAWLRIEREPACRAES